MSMVIFPAMFFFSISQVDCAVRQRMCITHQMTERERVSRFNDVIRQRFVVQLVDWRWERIWPSNYSLLKTAKFTFAKMQQWCRVKKSERIILQIDEMAIERKMKMKTQTSSSTSDYIISVEKKWCFVNLSVGCMNMWRILQTTFTFVLFLPS